MHYATKISDLNLNKFVDNLTKIVKKALNEGGNPENLVVVLSINQILEEQKNKALTSTQSQDLI